MAEETAETAMDGDKVEATTGPTPVPAPAPAPAGRIRADLLALTPGTLAALTNRGLVKRASKDIDAGRAPALTLGLDGRVRAEYAGAAVAELPPGAGLDNGSCDCGAAGVCRHLIGLVLAYQHAASTPAVPHTEAVPEAGAVAGAQSVPADESVPLAGSDSLASGTAAPACRPATGATGPATRALGATDPAPGHTGPAPGPGATDPALGRSRPGGAAGSGGVTGATSSARGHAGSTPAPGAPGGPAPVPAGTGPVPATSTASPGPASPHQPTPPTPPADWSPGAFDDETLTAAVGTRAVTAARRTARRGYTARIQRAVPAPPGPATPDAVNGRGPSSAPAGPWVELPTCTVRFPVPGEIGYALTDASAGVRGEMVALAVWAFRAADESGVGDGPVEVRISSGPRGTARRGASSAPGGTGRSGTAMPEPPAPHSGTTVPEPPAPHSGTAVPEPPAASPAGAGTAGPPDGPRSGATVTGPAARTSAPATAHTSTHTPARPFAPASAPTDDGSRPATAGPPGSGTHPSGAPGTGAATTAPGTAPAGMTAPTTAGTPGARSPGEPFPVPAGARMTATASSPAAAASPTARSLRTALDLADSLLLDGAAHAGPVLAATLRRTATSLAAASLHWPAAVTAELADQLAAHTARDAAHDPLRHAALLAELHARHRAAGTTPGVLGERETAETPLRRVRLTALGCRLSGTPEHPVTQTYFAHADAGVVVVLHKTWQPSDRPWGTRRVLGTTLASLAAGSVVSETARRTASRALTLTRGRLAVTTVTPLGPTAWSELPSTLLVRDLAAHAAEWDGRPPRLVRPRVEAETVRVVEISEVTDIGYDPGTQRLEATVLDAAGNPALISAPHEPLAPAALDALAAALASGPRHVAGALHRDGGRLRITPYAVAVPDGRGSTGGSTGAGSGNGGNTVAGAGTGPGINGTGTGTGTGTGITVPHLSSGEPANLPPLPGSPPPDPVADALGSALAALADAAHLGLRHLTGPTRTALARSADGLARTGLTACAATVRRFLEALAGMEEAPARWTDAQIRLLATAELHDRGSASRP